MLRRFALTHRIFRLVKTKTLGAYVRRAMRGPLPAKEARPVPPGRTIKVALIGVGKHARHVLLPAIAAVPELELAGLCVRTAGSRASLETQFDVPVVEHYDDLLTSDSIDAVVVATPSALHRYIVLDAIRAGKHVLCEAPGIVSEIDVAQVRAALQDSGAVVQYGHRFWYAPVYRALAEAVTSLGEPGRRTWRFVYSEALHLYGIALMLNGPIAWVEAHGKEHECTYDVEFANGDTGEFVPLAAEPSPDAMAERVEVAAASERLVARGGSRLVRVDASGEEAELGRFDFEPGYAQDHAKLPDGSDAALAALRERGYIPELESFIDCIRTGKPPLVGVEQAGEVFRLVWAMFESVGVGRRTEVRSDA